MCTITCCISPARREQPVQTGPAAEKGAPLTTVTAPTCHLPAAGPTSPTGRKATWGFSGLTSPAAAAKSWQTAKSATSAPGRALYFICRTALTTRLAKLNPDDGSEKLFNVSPMKWPPMVTGCTSKSTAGPAYTSLMRKIKSAKSMTFPPAGSRWGRGSCTS
jgi:hypothetical protein